jgi:hypothetical protein
VNQIPQTFQESCCTAAAAAAVAAAAAAIAAAAAAPTSLPTSLAGLSCKLLMFTCNCWCLFEQFKDGSPQHLQHRWQLLRHGRWQPACIMQLQVSHHILVNPICTLHPFVSYVFHWCLFDVL